MKSKRQLMQAVVLIFCVTVVAAAVFGLEDAAPRAQRDPREAQESQETPAPAAPPAQRTSVISVFGEYVTGFPFSFNGLTGRGALSGFDYTKFRDGSQSGWSAGVKKSFFSPGGGEGAAWGFGFQVVSLGVDQVLMEEEAVFGTLTQRPLLFGAFLEASLETFNKRGDNGFFLWLGAAAGTSRNSFRKGAFLEEIEAETGTVFEITAESTFLLSLGLGFRMIFNPFYVNSDFRVLWVPSEYVPTSWVLHGGSASLIFEDIDRFNADTISLTVTLGANIGLIRRSR